MARLSFVCLLEGGDFLNLQKNSNYTSMFFLIPLKIIYTRCTHDYIQKLLMLDTVGINIKTPPPFPLSHNKKVDPSGIQEDLV